MKEKLKTGLFERIYAEVKKIPHGRVATYGQIAAMSGNPRASRAVGWALHSNPEPEQIPCHRVVNRAGETSGSFAFGGADAQRRLLEAEGVEFSPDGRIDLRVYGYRPGEEFRD